MSTLAGQQIKDTYKSILHAGNFSGGIDGTLRTIEDGEGTASALQLSTGAVKSLGTLESVGAMTAEGQPVVKDNDVRLAQATESQRGTAELATQAETNAGTDDARIVTPLKLAGVLANIGLRWYPSLIFFGELIDEQIFGYWKAPVACRVLGVHWSLQQPCTGSAGSVDLVNVSDVEQSKVVTLTQSVAGAEALYGTALSLAAGDVVKAKIKSIGSTHAGTGLNFILIVSQ